MTMHRANKYIFASSSLWLALFAGDGSIAQVAGGAEDEHHVHRELSPVSDVLGDISVDFELVGENGALIRDEDFRGRYVLMGFGFTRCTDVCPIMVARMASTIKLAERELNGVFVSVDTERDTPADVHAYTTRFSEKITGLGGSVEQINTAADNFKISYVVTKTQRSYTVQHTSHMFLIDPTGKLVDVFAFTESPATIVAALN